MLHLQNHGTNLNRSEVQLIQHVHSAYDKYYPEDKINCYVLCCRVSQSGLTEGLSKIAHTTKVAVDDMSDEEKDNLLAKRESSHEYD